MLNERDSGSFRAVVLSLFTHALILLPLMMISRQQIESSVATLEVSIVPEQGRPEPPAEPPAEPAPQSRPPQPVKVPHQPQAAGHQIHRPQLVVPSNSQPEQPSTVVEADTEPEVHEASATSVVTSPSFGHQTEISQYKMLVWAQIQARRPNHVHVPGTTVVLFVITASGGLQSAQVLVPSGNARLDHVALDIVQNAAPFPPPPSLATEQELTFSIPFEFR